MTHNTGECRKYEKDNTLKNGFRKKVTVGQKCHGNGKKDHSNSFTQFMERFSTLEKAVKKTRKARQRRNIARNTVTLVILTQNRIMGTVVL